ARKIVVARHPLRYVFLSRVADGAVRHAGGRAVGRVLHEWAGVEHLLVDGGLELDLDAEAVRVVEGRQRHAARRRVRVRRGRGNGRRRGGGRGAGLGGGRAAAPAGG